MKNTAVFLATCFCCLALAAAQPALPIDQLYLYKNGMAYVVRNGEISEPITLNFHRTDFNDILKNLIAWNPQTGIPYPLGYSTAIPSQRLLERFPFDIRNGGLASLLAQMQGAELTFEYQGRSFSGRLLGMDAVDTSTGGAVTRDHRLTLLDANGRLANLWLNGTSSVRFRDSQSNQQLVDYLNILREGGSQAGAQITIQPTPEAGPIRVAYVQQFPVWKTSYRLELGQSSRLQGWVQIDNPTGEAWENVDLTLVSGSPVSFEMDLYSPLYASRRSVAVPNRLVVGPVAYEETVQTGRVPTQPNTIYGTIRDQTGAPLPGVQVTAGPRRAGSTRTVTTDSDGYYEISGLAPGDYRVEATLAGFSSSGQWVTLPQMGKVRADSVLGLGAVSELVEVESGVLAQRARAKREPATFDASFGASEPASAPAAPPPLQLVEAAAAQVEDYFEYRFPFKVSLRNRESALLPFLSREITAEPVSIFNASNHPSHPYNSVTFENSTGVPLEAGPITVLQEGRYAGEAVLEYLNRGAKGLISYGLDQELSLASRSSAQPEQVVRLIIQSGVARFFRESLRTTQYQIKSNSQRKKTILIEHPRNPSLRLKSPEPKESTASYYRFGVDLSPGQELELPVQEIASSESTLLLRRLSRNDFLVYFSNLNVPGNLKGRLQDVVKATSELNQLDQRLRENQRQYDEISSDQTRIRENLEALGKTSSEKRLAERYIQQLQAQEDQLEQLKSQRAQLQEERKQKEAELDRLVSQLSFDGDVEG